MQDRLELKKTIITTLLPLVFCVSFFYACFVAQTSQMYNPDILIKLFAVPSILLALNLIVTVFYDFIFGGDVSKFFEQVNFIIAVPMIVVFLLVVVGLLTEDKMKAKEAFNWAFTFFAFAAGYTTRQVRTDMSDKK